MKKIDFKINITTLLLIVIIVLLTIFGWKFYNKKVDKLNNKLLSEQKLKAALLDSVIYYQNAEKFWVAEKLTIQESMESLDNINNQLTVFQKELLWRIKRVDKTNSVIAAALMETNIKLDSLKHQGETIVDEENKKVFFSDMFNVDNKQMSYKFTVGNVLPSPYGATPSLFIDSIYFPNKQFIEFHWKNKKKKGYPIAFSVTNSNAFFQTGNVDSYIIPKVDKLVLNPNGWQKVGNFFKKNGDRLIYIGVGSVAGETTVYILTR